MSLKVSCYIQLALPFQLVTFLSCISYQFWPKRMLIYFISLCKIFTHSF